MLQHAPVSSLLFLLLGALPGATLLAAGAAAERPNIVVILADDLGWRDLRCQGNALIDTPNIDRLAAEGMRFTDAYAAAPVCTPTRAALMTGKSPARMRITNHAPGDPDHVPRGGKLRGADWTSYLGLEHETIAERLQESGYATCFAGKWHLSHRAGRDENGPHEPQLRPEHQGFDRNIGGCDYGGPPSYFEPYRIPAISPGKKGDYLPFRLADELIDFVDTCEKRPFFLLWWMYSVHYPFEAPEALVEKYRRRVGPGPEGTPPLKNPVYAAMIEGMDAAIGRLLDALGKRGLADSTLVVFTSDNGPFDVDSRPLRGEKGFLYEGGIRVPWIVRWPDHVSAGATSSVPIITTDLFPTLLEVAGLAPREGQVLDGESLVGLWSGQRDLQRDALFFHYPNYAFHKRNRLGSAIRVGDEKLIHWHEDSSLELYDLATDIGESRNLAATSPERARALDARLLGWLADSGAALPVEVPIERIATDRLQLEVRVDTNEIRLARAGESRPFFTSIRFESPFGSVKQSAVEDPIQGAGEELLLRHESGWETSLRLYPRSPFLHLRTIVENTTSEPFVAVSLDLARLSVDVRSIVADGSTASVRAFGTGGLTTLEDAKGSFGFSALVDPGSRRGVVTGFLTHDRGSGVLVPGRSRRQIELDARLDFGRFQVDPGQRRETETLLVGHFDDARLGLESWADEVALHHEIKLRPVPGVYCTWYHARASNEAKLLANTSFVRDELAPFGLSVMQIDDGWQKEIPSGIDPAARNHPDGGPVKVFVESNELYPRGMAAVAREISAAGLLPGIWFMPFVGNHENPYFADKQELFARNPDGTPFRTRWSGTVLDMTHPDARRLVAETTARIAGWGYRYFKLDRLHTGAICHNVYVNTGWADSGRYPNRRDFGPSVLHDPSMTNIEAHRIGLRTVREAAGDEVYILGCNVSQNMRSMAASFGLVDGMRIGPDNGGAGRGRWDQVVLGAHHGTNLWFLHRRVWHNDPDPVYVRETNPLESARLMVSWVAISGSLVTSSEQFAELSPERLDLLKRAMPSHSAVARPVDVFEQATARVWIVTDASSGERRDVVGLFNWDASQAVTIDLELEALGLAPDALHHAFDFWRDSPLPPVTGRLRAEIPAGSCRVLSLVQQGENPRVVSTSRHITQGLIDLVSERWDGATGTLSGSSRVVAGDPYELRVALPSGRTWDLVEVEAEDAIFTTRAPEGDFLRVEIRSSTSRELRWSLRFTTRD